jgi:hypothetical protein
MKKVIIGFMIWIGFASANSPGQFPQAEITNGLIHARLYLPDTQNGYYRASRFDWSGVMPELEYLGHSYFGQWFEKYSPTLHDAIMGPVEDFSPVGYDEAKTGDNFLKIGIGIVTRPEEPGYFFVTPYQLVNAGNWNVKKSPGQIEFAHTINDKLYSYEYQKTIQLVKGQPEMVLAHSLKNTGKHTIESNVYDHNFFMLDGQVTGKGLVIIFPFKPAGEAGGTGNFGKISGNQIVFQKDLEKDEHLFYTSLQGYSNSAKDYDIRIENHNTGAAVRITSDQPLAKLALWSAIKTVCPEPFIHLLIKPGETFTWKIYYQFYICDVIK